MRELSLHILDLLENSVQAGASVVTVSITQDTNQDREEILVEDNGPGLRIPAETVLDPFYTTKHGKKTGLGISLFKFRAEQAGGGLTLKTSELGGLAVHVTMQLSHIDRSPLGDLAATLAMIVCTTPDLDVRCRLRVNDREWLTSSAEIAHTLPSEEQNEMVIASLFRQQIQQGLATVGLMVD